MHHTFSGRPVKFTQSVSVKPRCFSKCRMRPGIVPLKYPVAFWPRGLDGNICVSKISIHASTLMLLSHIHMQDTHAVGTDSPPIPSQMLALRLLMITDGLFLLLHRELHIVFLKNKLKHGLFWPHVLSVHYLSVHLTWAWVQRTQFNFWKALHRCSVAASNSEFATVY